MPIEFTPSDDISFRYCFMNMRMRSGREKARPISIRYLPKLVRYLSISIVLKSLLYNFSWRETATKVTQKLMKKLQQVQEVFRFCRYY